MTSGQDGRPKGHECQDNEQRPLTQAEVGKGQVAPFLDEKHFL